MAGKDILEVLLSHVNIIHNSVADDVVGAILTVTWHHPRENIQSITSVITLNSLSANYDKNYSNMPYKDKILFKEERRGISYFTVELAVINDPGIFGKLLNSVIGVGINTIADPFLGAGMKAVIKEMNIDERKVVVISQGEYELPESESDIDVKINIKTTQQILLPNKSADESIFDDEEYDTKFDTYLSNGTPNGGVQFQIRTLS